MVRSRRIQKKSSDLIVGWSRPTRLWVIASGKRLHERLKKSTILELGKKWPFRVGHFQRQTVSHHQRKKIKHEDPFHFMTNRIAGWWSSLPVWKIWTSIGMMIPHWTEKHIHIPNYSLNGFSKKTPTNRIRISGSFKLFIPRKHQGRRSPVGIIKVKGWPGRWETLWAMMGYSINGHDWRTGYSPYIRPIV